MSGSYDAWKCRAPEDEPGFCEEELPEELIEDDYQDALDNPCSELTRKFGCTCRMSSVNSASIDPPEPVIDKWCPLHGGRDADAEYERMRDEGR